MTTPYPQQHLAIDAALTAAIAKARADALAERDRDAHMLRSALADQNLRRTLNAPSVITARVTR